MRLMRGSFRERDAWPASANQGRAAANAAAARNTLTSS